MGDEKNKTAESMRHHYFNICCAMKASLAEIDKGVEELVK